MTRRIFSALPFTPCLAGAGASIALGNSNHRLEFDRNTAQLLSLQTAAGPRQEFIESGLPLPAFVIQYLDSGKSFRQIASTQARTIVATDSAGEAFRAEFRGLGGLDLDAEIEVKLVAGEAASRWSITVHNQAGIFITDVQFPFIVVSYGLGGQPGTEALLRPYGAGQLQRAPRPQDMQPDTPSAWQFVPENGASGHYPGSTFAQFLAYYNNRAGVYAACQDAAGAIKLIKPVHRGRGIRLGFAHVGDWPTGGTRHLG